jgi:hypothetical protein
MLTVWEQVTVTSGESVCPESRLQLFSILISFSLLMAVP